MSGPTGPSDGDPTGSAEGHRNHGGALRAVALVLLLAGVILAGYAVWALWLTGVSAGRAQGELRRQWEAGVTADARPGASAGATTSPSAAPDTDGAPRIAAGDPYAVVRFARPDGSGTPVHAEPLYVVQGVGRDHLRAGPGHYPGSDTPGGAGNFAVAGHRTTYGAPFGRLDQLTAGDLIRVTDHGGRQWSYEVVGRRIVDPHDTWVLAPDPLGTGRATMTLTTCHPKWRASQRLVVFAELTPGADDAATS